MDERGISDTQWHLDKRVPITLIGVIFLQTLGMGWYASEFNQRVETLENIVATLVKDVDSQRTALALQQTETAVIVNELKSTNRSLNRLELQVSATNELLQKYLTSRAHSDTP